MPSSFEEGYLKPQKQEVELVVFLNNPLVVEQPNQQHDLDQLEELPFCCMEELEANALFESLTGETISLSKPLPSFIEEENLDSECASLGNNGNFELIPIGHKSLLRFDSFDELFATLVEEDGPLTMEEELT